MNAPISANLEKYLVEAQHGNQAARVKGNADEVEKWKEMRLSNMKSWAEKYPDYFTFSDMLANRETYWK